MISFSAAQRILVTGANSGIGRAVALRLNALGATVIANGRDAARLAAARDEAAHPDNFRLEPLDLAANLDALPLWVKELRERHGKLHGLAPCAGVSLICPLREYTREKANPLFDIHFHAPLLLAKGFADRRNNAGHGAAIVFMASGGAVARSPGLSVYGGAKGALITAGGVLSRELAGQGIRVNTLAPAIVNTPMGEHFFNFITPDAREKELAAYPFGIGEPDDVAGAAAFLLSAHARWITGQTIVLDGGRY